MGGGSFFQFEPDPGSNEENFVTSSLNQIETEEFSSVEKRGIFANIDLKRTIFENLKRIYN